MRHSRSDGFSLIEMLFVVCIIGILTALALPAWEQASIKSRRNEAISMLQRLAARQELFRIHHHRYATAEELAAPLPAGLGITVGTDYQVENQLIDTGYRATATVAANGAQRYDERCWVFSIDASGHRNAVTRSGQNSAAECWRS